LLQLLVTQRNDFDGILMKPKVKLPFSSGHLLVVPEWILEDAVSEFLGPNPARPAEEFTRANFSELVRRKGEELMLLPDGAFQERCVAQFWAWGLLKEVWGIQRRINCATNCNTKDPGSVAGVGDLHLSIIEDVIKPAQGCQTVVTMFQNGQLVVLASCVMTWAMNWAVKWAETLE